jgi:hypothetical protein
VLSLAPCRLLCAHFVDDGWYLATDDAADGPLLTGVEPNSQS